MKIEDFEALHEAGSLAEEEVAEDDMWEDFSEAMVLLEDTTAAIEAHLKECKKKMTPAQRKSLRDAALEARHFLDEWGGVAAWSKE